MQFTITAMICFSLEHECQLQEVGRYPVCCNLMWDGPFQWCETKINNLFIQFYHFASIYYVYTIELIDTKHSAVSDTYSLQS